MNDRNSGPDAIVLQANDWVPNNPDRAILHYPRAVEVAGHRDPAALFEALFTGHRWPARWRDGIHPFHHYHPAAHEVLGIAAGSATVILGGPGGVERSLVAGDVVVLPVGTGHCRLSASADLLVVGGYPDGEDMALSRSAPTPAMVERIRALAVPATDPVHGAGGPLTRIWSERLAGDPIDAEM